MNDHLESLTTLATLLEGLPHAALEAFETNQDVLCGQVHQSLDRDPELRPLLGTFGLDDVFDSEHRHAAFMSNVFCLGLGGILVATMPWAYRAYHARGYAHAYFPKYLEHWMAAIRETLPPGAAEPINGVYGWISQQHAYWVEVSLLQEPAQVEPPGRWGELQRAFLAQLLKGGHLACFRLAEANVKTVQELREFYACVLPGAFREVGDRWARDEIGVAEEHRASAIAGRVVDSLSHLVSPFRKTKGRAVITAAPKESHVLGARLLADLMGSDGWDVDFLGADLPAQELLRMLRIGCPEVLGISVTMPSNLQRVQRLIQSIRGESGCEGVWVLLGGHVFKNDPALWRKLGADAYAPDLRSALACLEAWWAGRTAP